ncbi:adenylosuccinate synthetase [Candidatus Pacearchaeota archaeon]|nr:adenylosuccinate synthetase [Candidatus Pacearchaeota archaeon]
MGLDDLLKNVQIAAIVCNQLGDTGKGKFSYYFASHWANVTARGTGGNNAGHTVIVNGKEKIFHLLPTGIVNDSKGQVTIMGNGMVIDLAALLNELKELEQEGKSYNNLMISKDAHVIMPYHVFYDRKKDQSQKAGGIGTTGRGIGPAYSDKIARRGITIGDLFNVDGLAKKVDRSLEYYPDSKKDRDEIISSLTLQSNKIKPFFRNTVSEMHRFVREGKKILLEGAQGLLLSIEHGTYPYVTSSDCSLNGTASGVGLSAKMIDLPLGIIKFPFMTRVGAGAFPSELGGNASEIYCAEEGHGKLDELKKYCIPSVVENGKIIYDKRHRKIINMMNSRDEFIQGVGIRLAAGEYGATTGRPRRVGWIDAVAAKYAVGINGPLFVLTKVDAVDSLDEFKVCYGYSNKEGLHQNFSKDDGFLRTVSPQYNNYGAYFDVSSIRDYIKLPRSLKGAIYDFENFTGGRVVIVSVGADREETIVR